MNKNPTAPAQTDEEILTFDASDEALEAAAAAAPATTKVLSFSFCTSPYVCPWQ